MYTLLPPKFRFGLFINSRENSFEKDLGQPLICFADSYEIKEDGSITFYQIGKTDQDKKFKIPVLAYPVNKWNSCIYLDNNNNYPVFDNKIDLEYEDIKKNNFIEQKKPIIEEIINEDNDLDAIFSSSNEKNIQPFSFPSDPKELKKMKNDWLEDHIKEYVSSIDNFNIESFLNFINEDSKNSTFQTTDIDIIWCCSNLILDKMVLSRKFSDPIFQKTLSFILPDIMRRQWDGHMSPILEVLQEKNETKDANAIDLAVWMAVNNFNT